MRPSPPRRADVLEPPYLFVYGSLRRAGDMHQLLQPGTRFAGTARLRGRLRWHGDYPAATDGDDWIDGELYQLFDAAVLTRTDAWEACGADDPAPHAYRRVVRDVVDVRGHARATWVYLAAS